MNLRALAIYKQWMDSHDVPYDIVKAEMPIYMKEAFHTALVTPNEKEPLNYYQLEGGPGRQRDRFVHDVIIANFYDYALHRTKLGVRATTHDYSSDIEVAGCCFDLRDATSLYEQHGYLAFSRASKIIFGNRFNLWPQDDLNSEAMLSILSTVPDSSVFENKYRERVLERVLVTYRDEECQQYWWRYRENDYYLPDLSPNDGFAPTIGEFAHQTNFTSHLVGRLWLMPSMRGFYDVLLKTILTLPHQTLWETEEGDESPPYVRRHTSRSMQLVLLARIANDLFEESFVDHVLCRGVFDEMYRDAMQHGYTGIALVLGLFVDRALVASCAKLLVDSLEGPRQSDIDANAAAALLYLLYLRNVSCKPSLRETDRVAITDHLLAPIFKNRDCPPPTLEQELRRDGLSRGSRGRNSPIAKEAIYRYFYNVMWKFITVYEKNISLSVQKESIIIGELAAAATAAVDSAERS